MLEKAYWFFKNIGQIYKEKQITIAILNTNFKEMF